MTFFISNAAVINNDGSINTVKVSTRSALSSGVTASYLAYVQDQNEFVVNTNTAVANTGIESTTYWYKFRTKPMDYKNEVILEQGTVGGGYISTSVWNIVSRIIYSNDVITVDAGTLPFANKYGGHFCNYLNAYVLQGAAAGSGMSSQDWATGTIASVAAQPVSPNSPSCLHPGPKLQNTFGLLLTGTSGYLYTYATNTWSGQQWGCPASQTYGDGTMGQNYGYAYTGGTGSVYYINFSTGTWVSAASGEAVNVTSSYGKMLGTKWNKFYYMGDNTSKTSTISGYNMTNNTWYNTNSNEPTQVSETAGLMGQDWGYNVGGYNTATSVQFSYSMKTFYANDTTVYSALATSAQTGLSSGAGNWGPIP